MRYLFMQRRARVNWVGWWILLTLLLSAKVAGAEPYKPDAGGFEVRTELMEWRDAERDRTVPIKLYIPADAKGSLPMVLVSHGLGGNRQGLSYLGKHWASHGYICVHMQHHGSDDGVWKGAKPRKVLALMRDAAMDPENAVNRAYDTRFVLDQLTRENRTAGGSLHDRLDLQKIAIAGHSFGAWTAMAAGGMTVGGQRGVDLSDKRIRCMIPLSPPVVSSKRLYEVTYRSMNRPSLFMTGTLDKSAISQTTPEQRLIPYRTMPGVSDGGKPKYQINYNGADHMTFSGVTRGNGLMRKADPKTDPLFHGLILQSTTAFLDAYLGGDQAALAWLNEGGFVKAIGPHGVVEMDP